MPSRAYFRNLYKTENKVIEILKEEKWKHIEKIPKLEEFYGFISATTPEGIKTILKVDILHSNFLYDRLHLKPPFRELVSFRLCNHETFKEVKEWNLIYVVPEEDEEKIAETPCDSNHLGMYIKNYGINILFCFTCKKKIEDVFRAEPVSYNVLRLILFERSNLKDQESVFNAILGMNLSKKTQSFISRREDKMEKIKDSLFSDFVICGLGAGSLVSFISVLCFYLIEREMPFDWASIIITSILFGIALFITLLRVYKINMKFKDFIIDIP